MSSHSRRAAAPSSSPAETERTSHATEVFRQAVRLSTKSTASLKNASIFSKGCRPLHRTSSGQSPHRSSRPDGQASLCSLAPPLPNKPASLGFVWVSSSHVCGLSRVFSDAHVAGKNKFDLIPSSSDDGTLRGSCTRFQAFLLFRQAETAAAQPRRSFCVGVGCRENAVYTNRGMK